MEILEFTSKEAAAPMMSVAAPLWFWKFLKKIQNFGFFLQISKIVEATMEEESYEEMD